MLDLQRHFTEESTTNEILIRGLYYVVNVQSAKPVKADSIFPHLKKEVQTPAEVFDAMGTRGR